MRSKTIPFILVLLSADLAGAFPPPAGFEIVQITHDPDAYNPVLINNCGQLVWMRRFDDVHERSEIFRYDNGLVRRITDNNVADRWPEINDRGQIVWYQETEFDSSDIWLFDKAGARPLFDGRSPTINDSGHIAFKRYGSPSCRGPEMDIYFWSGLEILKITDAQGLAHQGVVLNDHDEMVWTRYDFCEDPWVSDILLYRNGVTEVLTKDEVEPQVPSFSNLTQVAWRVAEENGQNVFDVWEDGETFRIVEHGWRPRFNDLGHIMYNVTEADGIRHCWVYMGGAHTQVTDEPFSSQGWDINRWGEVTVSIGTYPRWDIRLLRRIRTGDSEFDGDIDHDDLAKLVDCMTGPMWVERTNPGPEDSLCECRFLDINHDGSVDLRDYAEFQQNFGE